MSKQSDLAKGTFSGDLTVDTNTLVVDSVNNKVGIGTSVTHKRLSVSGDQRFYNTAADGLTNTVIGQIDAQVRDYGTNISNNNYASIQFATDPTAYYRGDIRFSTNGADATATLATERMRIDSAGRVTMPYQPSFEAQNVSNQNLTASWSNLIFGSVLSNRGGHYNGTNGRFTAPVDGFYQFNTVFLVSKANNTRLDAILVKNGAYYSGAEYQDYSSTSTNTSIVYTSCIQLATGDYVNIGSAAHGGSGAYFYGIGVLSRFSGHLVG